jgi:hypothetical protein
MRYIPIVIITFFTIIVSDPLFGQEDTLNIAGLGISIDPTKVSEMVYFGSFWQNYPTPITSTSAIEFYVPIKVTNKFRLEPSIGLFFTSSSTTTTPIVHGNGYSETTTNDASVVTIGIRGIFNSSLSNSLSLYYGPRLEFGFVSSTSEDGQPSQDYKTTTTETDITLGGVIGVEYFPIRKFSFGGEISLNYMTFGNPYVTNEDNPQTQPSTYTSERDQHTLYTGALFFMRWYFL